MRIVDTKEARNREVKIYIGETKQKFEEELFTLNICKESFGEYLKNLEIKDMITAETSMSMSKLFDYDFDCIKTNFDILYDVIIPVFNHALVTSRADTIVTYGRIKSEFSSEAGVLERKIKYIGEKCSTYNVAEKEFWNADKFKLYAKCLKKRYMEIESIFKGFYKFMDKIEEQFCNLVNHLVTSEVCELYDGRMYPDVIDEPIGEDNPYMHGLYPFSYTKNGRNAIDMRPQYCMYCGRKINDNVYFCDSCAKPMPLPDSEMTSQSCMNCGGWIPLLAEYCTYCGSYTRGNIVL